MASLAEAIQVAKAKIEAKSIPLVDFGVMPEQFKNHRGQEEAWFAKEAIVAIFAGWQSGKSVAGPPMLLREMQDRGPGDYAVLAPTYPLLRKKALPELLRYMRSKLKDGTDFVFKSGDLEIHILPPGGAKMWRDGGEAVIYLVNANNPQAVEAFTAKSIWIDEPGQIPDETWESVQARVAVEEGRIFLTSRPYDHNWYVREIWDKREIDPRLKVVNFSSKDNPAFPDAEYYRQKALLPWWKFRMKYDGIPTKPAGAIYPCFEPLYVDGEGNPTGQQTKTTSYFSKPIEIVHLGANVCKRFDIPKEWRRFSGHDFGPVNTAAVFAAQDPVSCKVYIHRAYHSGNKTVAEHVEQYRSRSGADQEPRAWGGAPSEEKTREDYGRQGWPIALPPIKELQEGLDRTFALIKTGVLVVFEDLANLIQELQNYSWELDDAGEPIEGKIEAKATWHRLDALRYLCSALYEGFGEDWQTADRFADQTTETEFVYPQEMPEQENPFSHLGWN